MKPQRKKRAELPIKVAPSILSADFGYLAEQSKLLELAGADAIHIDIMDGHFVPNLTLGPKAVEAINRASDLFLDVHLMMYNPFDYIERFVQAGADRITFHFEATENIIETLDFIHTCNCKAGIAFRPSTSHEFIDRFIDKCDLILLMTVEPGFGGQKFLPHVLEKIHYTKSLYDSLNISSKNSQDRLSIQVDGGINLETSQLVIDAGANVLVAGTYLYNQPDMKKAILELKGM